MRKEGWVPQYFHLVTSIPSQLLDMNRASPTKRMRQDKALEEEVAKYEAWRLEREERLS